MTTFNLRVPAGTDVPMSFVFDDGVGETGSPYRALLFVNGWMMGKRVANLGYVVCSGESLGLPRRLKEFDLLCRPQAKLPVHEGILDYNGSK